MLMQLEQVAMR